jgi:hypothetical protein
LQRITNDTGFISLTLYEGAGFVADEMKKQVKNLKVSKTAKKAKRDIVINGRKMHSLRIWVLHHSTKARMKQRRR